MEPSELVGLLKSNNLIGIALSILHGLDDMYPQTVPPRPVPSAELCAALDKRPAGSIPEELSAEFEMFHSAMLRRHDALAENERLIRTLLWAEQYLRENGRPEHEIVRAFNRDHWGVSEPASADIRVRWAQAKGNVP